jgi:hypothetical protein
MVSGSQPDHPCVNLLCGCASISVGSLRCCHFAPNFFSIALFHKPEYSARQVLGPAPPSQSDLGSGDVRSRKHRFQVGLSMNLEETK